MAGNSWVLSRVMACVKNIAQSTLRAVSESFAASLQKFGSSRITSTSYHFGIYEFQVPALTSCTSSENLFDYHNVTRHFTPTLASILSRRPRNGYEIKSHLIGVGLVDVNRRQSGNVRAC